MDIATLRKLLVRPDAFSILETVDIHTGVRTTLKEFDVVIEAPNWTRDGLNSTRSGLMQIWRMRADGQDQTHVVNEEANGWFPHPSPDGKWVAYVA